MGETMTSSLISAQTYKPSEITIVDLHLPRLKDLHRRLKINVSSDISIVAEANTIIVAVKPQDSQVVLELLGKSITKQSLLISIMAGVSLSTLKKHTKHSRTVRSMPNTPAQLQEGMTVWIATNQVSVKQKNDVRKIFASFGKQLEVKKEDLINVATAISGSGPAYVFAFSEYLIDAGQKLGLTKEQSTLLVKQTLRGSALLLDQSEDDAVTLRKKVTSKKGTTDAALKVFRSERIGLRVYKGIKAAYLRAKELSQIF